jgi:hypothetical protein
MTLSESSWAQKMTNLDLNQPEIKNQIAQKMTDLKVCTQNVQTIQAAYNECASNQHGELQFWQTPGFVVGGFVVTVGATTAILCLTHFMGACL